MVRRRRRSAVLLLAAVLVAAVLLVRPGTRADLEPVAGPSAAAEPTEGWATPVSPGDVADAVLHDLTPTVTGAGGLRLGEGGTDLARAGWELLPGEHGCARLQDARAADGSVLTGWVRDDVLVSVQVLAGRTLPATGRTAPAQGPPGIAFGAPVDTTPAADVVAERSAGGTSEVVTARRQIADRTVVVSDLGTGVARWAEVRTAAGEACEVGPGLAGTDPPQLALHAVDDAVRVLAGDGAGDLESQLGTPAARIPAATVTRREQPAPGCERLVLDDRFVLVHDELVVLAGQDVGRAEAQVPRVTWRAPAAAPAVRVLERVDRVATVRVRDDGVRLAADYVVRSWAPSGVDAFAVTEPPRVERVELGLGCPSALPWS